MEFFCLVSCTEDISMAVMLMFCSEGDNIPDAFALVYPLNDWLHLLEKPVRVRKCGESESWIDIFSYYETKSCCYPGEPLDRIELWRITWICLEFQKWRIECCCCCLLMVMFSLRRRVRCSGGFLPLGGCCSAAVSLLFSSEASHLHMDLAGVTVLNTSHRNHWWLSGQTAQSAEYTFCL